MTEQEMRELKAGWPKSIEELTAQINQLVEMEHSYGTCVYAMSIAATLAFNYVALRLGCTGFQSSVADLDIIRRTRNLDCPFILINLGDALYPQYDLKKKLTDFMSSADNKKWLKEQAQQKLIEVKESGNAASVVIDHWEILANS